MLESLILESYKVHNLDFMLELSFIGFVFSVYYFEIFLDFLLWSMISELQKH